MKLKFVTVFAAAFCVLTAFALAGGTKVRNGDFEKGSFQGWKRENSEVGRWVLAGPPDEMRRLGPPMPDPIHGDYSAYTVQYDESAMFMYRKVKLDGDFRNKLQFNYRYRNYPDDFVAPKDFRIDHENQQFRVDVLDPDAGLESLKDSDVIENVVRTRPGDPQQQGTRKAEVNLSSLGSGKVLVRFAVVVTEEPLVVTVDDVKVKSTKRK